MRLFIPACGDRLKLTSRWEFDLYLESRNLRFAEELDLWQPRVENGRTIRWEAHEGGEWKNPLKRVRAVLNPGTTIECDRVYIRTFNKGRVHLDNDYDSITWKVLKNGKPARNQRFWVKLPDCYNVEFELEPDGLYRNRVKLIKNVLEG